MPDLLVRLYQLPSLSDALNRTDTHGITIRRAQAYEQRELKAFIEKEFSDTWADEVMVAFSHQPVSAFIALDGDQIVGFGAYECTRKDYFGPTGVSPVHRGKGIGHALLVACLYGLWDLGYAYAIIGGAGPVDFYSKSVGAEVIEGSIPGIYTPCAKAEISTEE